MKLPKKPGKPDLKSPFQTRSFRVGGYSVFATAVVLAIAVVINLFAGALPAGVTQFDTTSSKLFSISDQTEQVLGGLESEVTIYWIVQSGQEDDTLGTLLNRYAGLSGKIRVEKKDPDVYPTFVQQYEISSLYNNSLIVECGDRYRYVSYSDIYEYDYSNYYTTGTYDVSFAGENQLTSAIRYVVSEDLPKLYLLTGHGEASLSTSFQSAVEQENIDTEELSLLTAEAVPEDADCLLINAPQSDLSEEEKEMLLAYLQSGGSLMLITSPLQDGSRLANLEAVMEYYGVTASEGIVIEGSQSNYALGVPYYLLPDLSSHTITTPLKSGGYYVLLPVAQGLNVSEELRDGLTVSQLLTTSDASFSKIAGYALETYDREDGDIDGPFALAVAVSETLEDDETAHIVWVSSSSLVDDQTNQQVSGGNEDFFLNALGWMCEQEETISIRSKSIGYEYLTMSSAVSSTLTVVIVGIIPLACLGTGIGIRVRRKRR